MTIDEVYEILWRTIRRLIVFAAICFWVGYLLG